MARHILLVFTKPVAGQEAEYDQWYDGAHLDEVLTIDGVVSAERFDFVDHDDFPAPPRRHLAIYDVETDDADEFLRRLVAAAHTLKVSPAIDIDSVKIYPFVSRAPARSAAPA